MKKTSLFILFCCCFAHVKAQSGNKYFINEKEVIPQSLDFLDISDIDTIHIYERKDAVPYLGATATAHDSAVVVTMKKGAEILSLPQLLDSFDIEKDAISLKVITTLHSYKNGLSDPSLFFASKDMVLGISVESSDIQDAPHHDKAVFIALRYVPYMNTNALWKTIHAMTKQYNRIENN